MAYGMQAYRLDTAGALAPAPRADEQRARVRAVRTGQAAPSGNPQILITLARLAVVVVAVVAALCFARIALTSAAVATLIESDTLSAQIEDARADGVSLEMQQSVLSSPAAIKQAAKRLGMAAPGEVGTIALDPDIVAFDEQGGLSLSASVKNAVEARE